MRTGTRFGSLRTQHANELVAVCHMMSCLIELQKRCTNEQTLHMQQLCSSSFHRLLEFVAVWCSAR